jgi:serine acetyltransferase
MPTVSVWSDLKEDIAVRSELRGCTLVVTWRLANWARGDADRARWWSVPFILWSKFLLIWISGVDIAPRATIGPGLRLDHAFNVRISPLAIIGKRCVIRNGVTIGSWARKEGRPTIGDDVQIGVNAVILGAVTIGDQARIGAGAIVVKDVPAGATVVGNPARVVNQREVVPKP